MQAPTTNDYPHLPHATPAVATTATTATTATAATAAIAPNHNHNTPINNNVNNNNNNNTTNNNTPSPSTYPSYPNPSPTPTTTSTPSPTQSQNQSRSQPPLPSQTQIQGNPSSSSQPVGEYQCHHADCLRRFARKTSLTNHLKAHNNHRSRSIYRTKRARLRAAAAMQAAIAHTTPSSSSPRRRSTNSRRPISLPVPSRPSSSPTTSSDPPISHTLPPRPPSSPPANLSFPQSYFSAPQPSTQVNHSQSYPLLCSTHPNSNASNHSFQSQSPSPYPLHSSAPSIVPASHSMQTQPVLHQVSVENTQNPAISSGIAFTGNALHPANMASLYDPNFNIHHNFMTDRTEEPLVSPSGWPTFPSPTASTGVDFSLSLLSPRSFGQDQPASLTALDLLFAPEGTPFPPTNAQFVSPGNAIPSSTTLTNVDLPWPMSTASNHNSLQNLHSAGSHVDPSLFLHDEPATNPVIDSGVLSSVTPPTPGEVNPPCIERSGDQRRLDLLSLHTNRESGPGHGTGDITLVESMGAGHMEGSNGDPCDMPNPTHDGETGHAADIPNTSSMAKTRNSSGHTDVDLLANYDILPDLSFD